MNAPAPRRDVAPALRGQLYVVSAPSGAGKTSLVRALVESTPDLVLSVSHTTRPPRSGEVDGAHYHFVDAGTFETMARAGAFLEHATVFGHRYGTSRELVERELRAGRDVVLEIDWQGARQVRERLPSTTGVFILPPSRETLLERLRRRGQDSEEVIARRTAAALEELRHHHEFAYLVVNDAFERALDDLRAIVRAGRLIHARRAAILGRLLSSLLAE